MTFETIHYNLRFPNARQHMAQIEAFFPNVDTDSEPPQTQLVISMPVWTPGSYLVREYARNIEAIEACDARTGSPLAIRKLDKHRWKIDCHGCPSVCVRYSLYCREASVRTNWVDDEYGFLTGAATFLTLDDSVKREHILHIFPPDSWPTIACSLPPYESSASDGAVEPIADPPAIELWHCFSRRAISFDELVDSPILMGDIAIRPFDVSGKRHYLACLGTDGAWDLDRATADCAEIVAHQHSFWGVVPYPSYWFINMAIESYGGLEHDNNTVLVTSHWAMRKRSAYVEWLGLVSHEFFHTWNIRRLRPKNLVQYDYGAEQYIPELWIAEGITSYFDDLIVLRAGLTTQTEYLGLLGKTIQQVEESPGRLVQTLKDSSFDTWIKHYRPDENAINSRISYYTKGAVVAFLLDIHLRRLSDDRISLSDVMRMLWNRFRVDGYRLADFEAIASELAGANLDAWFDQHVHRSDQLDYTQAFDWLGLEMESVTMPTAKLAAGAMESYAAAEGEEPEWELGCETALRDGRVVITKIVRDSAASKSGLQVDDELIAFSGHRLPKDHWKERLQCYRFEQELVATVARRGRLREIRLRMQPRLSKKLQSVVNPTSTQVHHRLAWLSDENAFKHE